MEHLKLRLQDLKPYLQHLRERIRQSKRPPVPVIIVLALAILIGGCFLVRVITSVSDKMLKASGTIEATEVNISPELAGMVAGVLVDEGNVVKSGDILFRLDDTLLQAQRKVTAATLESAKASARTAQSALASAQAQYDLTLMSVRAEDQQTRLADWFDPSPDYFNQPSWYFTRSEQITAAQAQIDAAKSALNLAQTSLNAVIKDLNNVEFLKAEKRLTDARIDYLVAKDVYALAQVSDRPSGSEVDLSSILPRLSPYANTYRIRIRLNQLAGNEDLVNAAQDVYDAATVELKDAQQVYSNLLNSVQADKILTARADLSVAQERYNVAQDRLNALQTGSYSPKATAAESALEQAKAAAQQAQATVTQAEAQLALIDTQIAKMTTRALMDGVVLTRNIEPGEYLQPGSSALVLARLDDLTITVYIPEDRYGQIKIGQTAEVSVDSFPGQVFMATVVHIADRAEFTPRNVQTVEGRSTTVYAIKLAVDDPEGRLTPGMPADVIFKR